MRVAREREEAKRLLYVAVTRARDRLYLRRDVCTTASSSRAGLGWVMCCPPDFAICFLARWPPPGKQSTG